MSTLKRSKKEIEFAWDKERRELNTQVSNLDAFARDLQSQLAQAKLAAAASLNSASDQYALNERLQSLTGENEFLKNRIRELELMLDELDQVKRFLIESKQVYDNDRYCGCERGGRGHGFNNLGLKDLNGRSANAI